MAKCNFEVEVTKPMDGLIEHAREGIRNAGGTFEGDSKSGNYSIPTPLGKVVGTYTVEQNTIHFEINEKPLLVGCKKIESELRKQLDVAG